MKIYTRSGDNGYSSIRGGTKLPKYSMIFELLGDLDELNSILGLSIAYIRDDDIREVLRGIQKKIFDVGIEIQKIETKQLIDKEIISEGDIRYLEESIDSYVGDIEIKEFILPGGSTASCYLHLARAVCRRAERKLVKYLENKNVKSNLVPYLNRLSDLLYALAIYINLKCQVKEKKV